MSDQTREPSRRVWPLDLVFDADPVLLSSLRSRMSDWLREQRWPEDRIGEVVLALNEVVTNSVLHAYDGAGGRVGLSAEVVVPFPGMLTATFVVRDRGRWRHRRDGEPGYGLQLVRELMDEVRIRREPEGTTVVLSTPIVAPRRP
jgi:anti-sigma regulatory factor (Ser/Thr protein kinase)